MPDPGSAPRAQQLRGLASGLGRLPLDVALHTLEEGEPFVKAVLAGTVRATAVLANDRPAESPPQRYIDAKYWIAEEPIISVLNDSVLWWPESDIYLGMKAKGHGRGGDRVIFSDEQVQVGDLPDSPQVRYGPVDPHDVHQVQRDFVQVCGEELCRLWDDHRNTLRHAYGRGPVTRYMCKADPEKPYEVAIWYLGASKTMRNQWLRWATQDGTIGRGDMAAGLVGLESATRRI